MNFFQIISGVLQFVVVGCSTSVRAHHSSRRMPTDKRSRRNGTETRHVHAGEGSGLTPKAKAREAPEAEAVPTVTLP